MRTVPFLWKEWIYCSFCVLGAKRSTEDTQICPARALPVGTQDVNMSLILFQKAMEAQRREMRGKLQEVLNKENFSW